MKEVYITGDHILSALGATTDENLKVMDAGMTGIRTVDNPALYPHPLQLARVDTVRVEEAFSAMLCETGREILPGFYTRLEKMMILSVYNATRDSGIDLKSKKTGFILSTTKGNIHLLEEQYRLVHDHKRLFLWELSRQVASFFGIQGTPMVVSNACISGVVAVIQASRLIRSGRFSHVVVCGGDLISEFVISGFQSFQSLSPAPCRPYDLHRDGLSLGEGCGTVVLSETPPLTAEPVLVMEGAVTNDANHISGPSRTGEELGMAITTAMHRSGVSAGDISFINAHGTATPFNDEMESKAIHAAGLQEVPVNSLKGYWGHTLGAAGLIEIAASAASLRSNLLIGTAGFSEPGTPLPLRVYRDARSLPMKGCVKTASGFGGCNAALVLQKQQP